MFKILVLTNLILVSCSTSISQSQPKHPSQEKEYSCQDACVNYHNHMCKSPIDSYPCESVCSFFKGTVVTKPVLNCLSVKNTCKSIFACVGY
jgi:hypothetical protein